MKSALQTRGITVIFLFYHSPHFVAGLVEAIRRQRHPSFRQQEEWLEVIFMDNGSTDDTGARLREHLAGVGEPAHYRLVTNPVNIGYARAVNKALGLVKTPYALTCHCDCLFGSDDYVASMLDLLERHPDAGTITGQPAVPEDKVIPFAEKVNLVAYLMDIFPARDADLISIGFAEGRCDGFRIAAVEAAGFYDTSHHSAGEDQVLCAAMRKAGYRIYQAPKLRYFLSVSDEQDTISKLLAHLRLFGEKHPVLVLKSGAGAPLLGEDAGANRRARTLLRLNQLLTTGAYFLVLLEVAFGAPAWTGLSAVAAAYLWKALIFRRHIRAVRFSFSELAGFLLLQPVMDLAYTIGVATGLWGVVTERRPHPAPGAPS